MILIEPIYIITFGLGLDIIGAYMVLRPLIHLYKRYWGNQVPDMASEELNLGSTDKNIVASQKKDTKDARIGFIFLLCGFIAQIIGNWMQNSPF